ncbi:MAG: amidohydrolase [Halieaceae bacterium]|nr:amidohydrolase [Halieaceae bacterium]
MLGGCKEAPGDVSEAVGQEILRADTVVINAKVYTDGSSSDVREAFAIQDGRFLAVDSTAAVREFVGDATQVIDAQGAVVFPGLIDAHVHPSMGGQKVLYMCNFAFDATPEELANTIEECAQAPNAPDWIVGGQWSSNFFVDHDIASPRQFLDAVSGDHPVFLDDDSAHHGWANTKALKLAGIPLSAEAKDPIGGVYVRDSNGIPNGVLLESAAGVVSSMIPPYTLTQQAAGIAAVSNIANSYGVTAFGDARVPEMAMHAYKLADEAGELNIHAVLYQQSYGHGGEPEPLESVATYDERAIEYGSENLKTRAIKFFLDGVPTASRSALMVAPYTTDAQHPEATLGMQMIATEELERAVLRFDAAGYLIKIHTAGDGAVRIALDAIESARGTNGAPGQPISLAHAGYIDPADLPRFRALNAVADFSPYLWYPRPIIDSVLQAVGSPRGEQYWPTRDLLNSGALINGGSDWPAAAADMNPWPALESLVTRQHPTNGTASKFWAEQSVSLDEAIVLWTTQPALILGIEDEAGSIAAGKSADFIMLNQDIHNIPIDAISETSPLQTWFRGRQVFESK